MGLEIYANGIKLDLPDTVRVAFTFQVNNIAELRDRQASFSNQFKAPKSDINQKALGFAATPTSGEGLQHTKVPCTIVDNGIQTIPEGYLIIENFDGSYGLTIYAGVLKLFEGLEALKINQLTEISDRHFWTAAAARGSLSFVSNYRYLVVDYGGTITAANIDAQYLLPWINRRKIWDKIFEGTGFTVSGDLLDSPELVDSYLLAWSKEYPSELVECSMRVSDADSWTTVWNFIAATGFAPLFQTILADPLAPLNPQLTGSEAIGYSPTFPTDFTNWSTFRCRASGTYLIEWDVEMRTDMGANVGIFPGNVMKLKQINAGDSFFTDSYTVGEFEVDNWDGTIDILGQYGQFPPGSEKLHKYSVKLTLQEDDLVFLYADNHPDNGPLGSLPFFLGSRSTFRIKELTEAPVLFGGYVDPWAMLPDMTQKDFIKAIAQELGLIFDVDLMAKTCRVYNYTTVKSQQQSAKDWSAKIVNLDEVKHEYHATTYARENFFKYRTESGQSETLGRGSFTIPDETLEDVKDLITLPWAGTEMIEALGQQIPQIKIYDGAEWADPTTPRVLMAQTEATALAWSINGTALPLSVPVAWFEIYTKSANMGWVNLLEKYYPDLILSLQKYLKTTVPGILKPADVCLLDFSIPIYLRQFSAYFYLNKINQYRNDTPIKIELIRL